MDINLAKLPYRFQDDVHLKRIKVNAPAGISISKVWDHITDGSITDGERLILQLLFELEFLTAEQIRQCHANSHIPPQYKHMPLKNKKNPYHSSLSHLARLGMVYIYDLFSNEKQVGVRIYGLSQGVKKWMVTQTEHYFPIFHKGMAPKSQNSAAKIRPSI